VRQPEMLHGVWHGYSGGADIEVPELDTGVPQERLAALLAAQTRFPESFHPHPRLKRPMQARIDMSQGHPPRRIDWSAAEALAFATLLTEGVRVRLTGQDSERGTFSQRHAVLHDYVNGHTYVPLAHLAPDQAPVEIINSPLSEAGVLGFEYGYSLDCPDGLVLWEAQFGDFINAAQVIVDQFIASAERKWYRLSGLVLLLPHGFEGQGPEHSSARLERFLTIAAEDNIQVVCPSTPAQYFHVLRRQVLRRWRKPLVVMSPKSLLRHPRATSTLEELASGRFQRIIPDATVPPERLQRVLMCSGKIFYDLMQRREELQRHDIAIVRIEQLYPLAEEALATVLGEYREGTSIYWVQEEPENMGAWRYLRVRFGERIRERFPFSGIYRRSAASPATGSHSSHKLEQQELVERALVE
ncbi:MAG TPA: 2-oxoglutarate dehydrogenase E1 component, partial [Phycisphaerae bacterium]